MPTEITVLNQNYSAKKKQKFTVRRRRRRRAQYTTEIRYIFQQNEIFRWQSTCATRQTNMNVYDGSGGAH